MKSFHSDIEVKNKYLARVREHQAADNLIRGEGWTGSKGCAVGCTLEAYEHSRYETELGIPEWLAYVEDSLFEGMMEDKSQTWPEKFLESIPVGVDLEPVRGKFLIIVLERALSTFDHSRFPEVKASIDKVSSLWKNGGTAEEFSSASRAAWAAARASKAWAASKAAEAASWAASKAAEAASKAAEAASWAASWAASRAEERLKASCAACAAWAAEAALAAEWAAAGVATYDYYADELLILLQEAK